MTEYHPCARQRDCKGFQRAQECESLGGAAFDRIVRAIKALLLRQNDYLVGIAPAVRKALDGFRCPCEMDGIDWQREREPSHGQAGERGKPLSMFKSKYNVL